MNDTINSQPKVFISYSWSSESHKETVREWANKLIHDGVETVLDQYNLNEGDDTYAFMESMVTDGTVTHVLIVCDKQYAEKSDVREAGVGTESQIISAAIYKRVKQSKFLPIVTQFDAAGEPYLPTFLGTRFWIDFSSPEASRRNWEQLLRVIYDKPIHKKPELGKTPDLLNNRLDNSFDPLHWNYKLLEDAILNGLPSVDNHRSNFLDSCIEFGDSLRVREEQNEDSFRSKFFSDSEKLRHVRNHIVNWILLESNFNSSEIFTEKLLEFLEKLYELKLRPEELSSWKEDWFLANAIFIYETFLYIVAALLKRQSFHTLHEVFSRDYYLSTTNTFRKFGCFYADSKSLSRIVTDPEGKNYISPSAEVIKRQADRNDLPFKSVAAAEVLVYMMALIRENFWYPGTSNYSSYNFVPELFQKCCRQKDFKNLAIVTGYENALDLKEIILNRHNQPATNQYIGFTWGRNFPNMMNLDLLDSLQ